MDSALLIDMARHQSWADAEHWKVLRANPQLLEDAGIRKHLSHMMQAYQFLQAPARGEQAGPPGMKDVESAEGLEEGMKTAHETLIAALPSADLEKSIQLPRGPKGPFAAPAGVLLLQAITHSQHHRGQNASRIRELGVTPPMTDYIIWFAVGKP